MITEKEYLDALNLIKNYRMQLQDQIKVIDSLTAVKVDLSKYIPVIGLNIFCDYYFDIYEKRITVKDLENVDIQVIKDIDFKRLNRYRGLGRKTTLGLKQILSDYNKD